MIANHPRTFSCPGGSRHVGTRTEPAQGSRGGDVVEGGDTRRTCATRQRMPSQPSKEIQTFPNPAADRDYEIAFDVPEFTCLCPLTGQPDFARFTIKYVPDQLCVELKSLKLYMWSYRNEGAFHEKVTNTIADDIIKAIQPRKLTVVGDFFVRGGIGTIVTVTHEKKPRA